MQKLINRLQKEYPELKFSPGKQYCWSPESNEIFYKDTSSRSQDLWSLLHEVGHALLSHHNYQADFELIKMEMAAWAKAEELAQKFKIGIDQDHIEECLDTYRDWIYKRSICPSCTTKCLQTNDFSHYSCFNCHTVWRVSASRFCRSYRSTHNIKHSSLNQLNLIDNLI